MNKKLESWFLKNYPDAIASLSLPTTLGQLEKAEKRMKVKLPKSFKEFYLCHNGQKGVNVKGLFFGWKFLPLKDVIQNWKIQQDTIESLGRDGIMELSKRCESQPRKYIQCLYASSKWIPFAHDGGGNYIGLDYDPDERGAKGQVINFGRDEIKKYVIAKNFSDYLKWFTEKLNSSKYTLNEHEFSCKANKNEFRH